MATPSTSPITQERELLEAARRGSEEALSGNFRWRHLPARANGQAAVGCYTWHPEEESFLPFALDVLTLDGERIKEVTAFITRSAKETAWDSQ